MGQILKGYLSLHTAHSFSLISFHVCTGLELWFHVIVDVSSLNASCKNIYQLGKDLSEFGRSSTAL